MKPQLVVCEDLEYLSLAAARFIIRRAARSLATEGRFTLALSGGRTPRRLYEILSAHPYREKMPWKDTFFFWGDERFVPHDHPESNYGLASRTLLSKVPVPAGNIHPVKTDTLSLEEAACDYELDLKRFFELPEEKKPLEDGGPGIRFPHFDLIILGLGEDGHTASLFPGDPALDETGCWAAPVRAPSQYAVRDRVTLTFPLLNNASCVIFLASGSEKKTIIETILREPGKAYYQFPAARVRPQVGELRWFIDRESGPKIYPG
jgi:6-phosphogluconolactonase